MNCQVCGDSFPLSDLFHHFRIMHPDLDVIPERWPDGSLAVYDETIEDEFFQE